MSPFADLVLGCALGLAGVLGILAWFIVIERMARRDAQKMRNKMNGEW